METLDAELRARYIDSSPDPDVTWMLGSAVAAYYAPDNMYYRGRIVGFDDDGIEVSHSHSFTDFLLPGPAPCIKECA